VNEIDSQPSDCEIGIPHWILGGEGAIIFLATPSCSGDSVTELDECMRTDHSSFIPRFISFFPEYFPIFCRSLG
jgi:hypothetical protein